MGCRGITREEIEAYRRAGVVCLCVGLVISQGSIADNHSQTKATSLF